jgi:hypothetical protein
MGSTAVNHRQMRKQGKAPGLHGSGDRFGSGRVA